MWQRKKPRSIHWANMTTWPVNDNVKGPNFKRQQLLVRIPYRSSILLEQKHWVFDYQSTQAYLKFLQTLAYQLSQHCITRGTRRLSPHPAAEFWPSIGIPDWASFMVSPSGDSSIASMECLAGGVDDECMAFRIPPLPLPPPFPTKEYNPPPTSPVSGPLGWRKCWLSIFFPLRSPYFSPSLETSFSLSLSLSFWHLIVVEFVFEQITRTKHTSTGLSADKPSQIAPTWIPHI